MPQILESPWFADLHAFRISVAEITFDHFLVFGRIKDATVGTGQSAEKASDASFVINRDNSCFRVFMDRSGRTDMQTVRVVALETDHWTVIGLFEVLDRPDSGATGILSSNFDLGTGLLAIKAVITFLRVDG
jgi:hypothetical protein